MPFAIESLSNNIRYNGEWVISEINSYRLRVRLNIPQFSGVKVSKFLGEQSEMAISTSPDAAGVMKGLFTSQQSGGGLMGLIKKFLKF
jgi:hypothetical protein